MKFQDFSIHGSKVTGGIKKRVTHTDTRTHKPKAICPYYFFKVWGIINKYGDMLVTGHFVPRSFRTHFYFQFGHFIPSFWSFRTHFVPSLVISYLLLLFYRKPFSSFRTYFLLFRPRSFRTHFQTRYELTWVQNDFLFCLIFYFQTRYELTLV